MKLTHMLMFYMFLSCISHAQPNDNVVSLNGVWEIGKNRNYNSTGEVPGIVTDPTKMNEGKLWYKRKVHLPSGNWKYATLYLKGARFDPEVYINSQKVSQQNGGMAPTSHLLDHPAIKPNKTVILEIALLSLEELPVTNASYIPIADHWRSNISSYLWDDVLLHFHGSFRISRIIPFTNIDKDQVTIHWELENITGTQELPDKLICEFYDLSGKLIIRKATTISALKDRTTIHFKHKMKKWSPEHPNLYKLCVIIKRENQILDKQIISYGVKEFKVENKTFQLNGHPYLLRAGTVVWHRWTRDMEATELAFDTTWFHENVIKRLKEHGANTLRFHLGNPPERFLNLCDKYGLLVQYEWSFFHGMPASKESLLEQWKNWLDLALIHPSVSLIHPYNETTGDQLKIAWSALNKLLRDYPPLIMEERDVIHIHKYWWSLFENLGIYYDSASQFPKAIMVDEFGGNYLDGYGNPGGYKTLQESFLRFLGRNHTAEMRLKHHTISNSRVAEYWRRIGAAGFSPFTILGSWEDGNHWFMGEIKNGNPKPVWKAMSAAWSPQSVSLEIWDRNFLPNQQVTIPVYFFNDTGHEDTLNVIICIVNNDEKIFSEHRIRVKVKPYSRVIQNVTLTTPSEEGEFTFKAILVNRPENVKYPVVSEWDFRTYKAKVPVELKGLKFGIANDDFELKAFLSDHKLFTTDISDKNSDIILTSYKTWKKIEHGDIQILKILKQVIEDGKSIVMLDVGPVFLGQGYPKDRADLGPLQGVMKIKQPEIHTIEILGGITLVFKEVAEPESHIHPDKENDLLWENLKKDYTWLWNGMRGGTIVPATKMEVETALSPNSYLKQWKTRGADPILIRGESYYAYELQGFYSFSTIKNDITVSNELRKKVLFHVEDAPALANSINPNAPIKIIDLVQNYKNSTDMKANKLIPLVNCGKNLTQIPVILIDFGNDQGNLIISQLLTKGRLAKGFGTEGLYGIRYDEVAVQFVLNMLKAVII